MNLNPSAHTVSPHRAAGCFNWPGTKPPEEPPKPPAPPNPLDPPVNRDRLVDTFIRFTQVEGPTRNERKIADAIKAELADLGLSATEDDAGPKIGGNTGNLIVNIKGNVEGAPSLLFAAHMDTVPLAVGVKPQIGEDGIIRSDGTTALGGDNRAGVSEILEAYREIKENNLPHGDLQFLFTVGEEGGLLGARALDPSVLKSDFGFAVDVFKANQLYTQGRHLLIDGQEPDFSPEGVHAAKDAAANSPIIPPEHLDLRPEEVDIMNFAGGAMKDIGLEPEFHRIEWAGTDAIALRRHGMNAISLGAGENRPHTTREFVEINDLVASTTLIRSMIAKAAAQGMAAAAVGGPAGAALATA